jgi:hypothetical protein
MTEMANALNSYFGDLTLTATVEAKIEINKRLIDELKDAYIGIDGTLLGRDSLKKFEIDLNHKKYFGAFIKETAVKNTFKNFVSFRGLFPTLTFFEEDYHRLGSYNTDSLEKVYQEFYFEQFLMQATEQAKNKSRFNFNLFKFKKLPVEDASFFNNLKVISAYMKGENVENIEEKIDFVLEQRREYQSSFPVEERKYKNAENIKSEIRIKKYESIFTDFKEISKTEEGTNHMLPVIDNFIEDTLKIFSDFKKEVPGDYQKEMFGFVYNQYSKIFSNENIGDKKEVVWAFNNFHEKIFGTKKEMIKLDFKDDVCSYEKVNNPYLMER